MEITINNKVYDIYLYNIQYWNQRFFALGQSKDGLIFKKFISTKGFDKLLIESDDGPSFIFKKDHFSPYLCSREKDIYRESEVIRKNNSASFNDIGPNNFSGNYTIIADLGSYKDDLYFETRQFTEPDFNLFKYQNDDLYYIQNQSNHRDKLPLLTCLMDANIYDKISIIHGVDDLGNDYFDLNSIMKIIDTDLAYPEKSGFYQIIRALSNENPVYKTYIVPTKNYGTLEFSKLENLNQFRNDCGFSYIKQSILKKITKRKYALRYLYEYYITIDKMISSRRRSSASIQTGPKEFKKEEFNIVFDPSDCSSFSIIFYKDVFTIDRKNKLSQLIPGDAEFRVNGYYNFLDSSINYDEFESNQELIAFIKNKIGTNQSIKLASLLSLWMQPNFGYAPRIIKLKMSSKANSKALVDSLTLYNIPIIGEDSDIYGSDIYVNLYGLLANFGIHLQQVRTLLKCNEFSISLYKLLETNFGVFHVCRDYRRSIFKWEEDEQLNNLMIKIQDAKRLINIFEQTGGHKNSYWYSNANQILTSFISNEIPQLTSIRNYFDE